MKSRRFPLLLVFLLCLAGRAWPQAANDNFDARLPLTGSTATAVSNVLTATHEPGEPNHAYGGGSHSLWWTWTAPATGTANFIATGKATNPGVISSGTAIAFAVRPIRSLALYTGSSLASLTEVASANTTTTSYSYPPVTTLSSFNAPVTAGTTYQIAVDAPTTPSFLDDGTVVLTINQAPVIYSPAGVGGVAGAAFSYGIQAFGNPTAYSATDVPPGLSLNATTGELFGQLPAPGTYRVHLAATNPGGTGTATLTLTVSATPASLAAAPTFYGDASAVGYIGVAFSYYLYGSNASTYTCGDLPPGLTADYTYGQISGIPTRAGSYTVPVSVTNALGTSGAVIVINVLDAPRKPVIDSSLSASGTVGGSFSYYISAADNSTAGSPLRYGASDLPPGIGLSPTSGTLHGTPTASGVFSVPISATNAGGTGTAVVTVVIADAAPASAADPSPSGPPLLNSAAVVTATVGTALTSRLSATGFPTAFTAANLPSGVSLNAASGYLTGTPLAAGTYSVPVTAANAFGTTGATLTLVVLPAGTTSATSPPLTITSPAAAGGYLGQSLYYPVQASPGNRQSFSSGTVTCTATNLPPGLSLVNSPYSFQSAYISGTPTAVGTYQAVLTATPGVGYYPSASAGSATVTFVIASGSAPGPVAAPVFSNAAAIATNVGYYYSNTTLFTASNSPTAYTASGLPPGLTLNAANGTVSGSPTAAGTYPVAAMATNSVGTGTATVTFVVAATATSVAPTVTSNATAAGAVGVAFSYSIYTSDYANSYTATNLPPGLTFSTANGTLTGTPTTAGVYRVPISATVPSGGTASATLTFSIAAAPDAPVINSYSSVHAAVGTSLSYYVSASGSPTGYAASNLPPGLAVNATSGSISGTPTAAGEWVVPISATNAGGTGSAVVTFQIAPQASPAFSGKAAASGSVGKAFSYTLSASPGVTAYTADNLPPGLTLTASSGTIAGTPNAAGTYQVPVSATNAAGSVSATLTLTISAASVGVPVISSAAAASGSVGAAFSYTVTASNSPTSYSLEASAPPGLTFNAATGTLSGTPGAAGTYYLPVRAVNAAGTGQAKVTLVFTTQPLGVPVITSPAEFAAYSSEAIYYPITATNQPTSYAASGLPTGLSIDPATGLITGTLASSSTSTFTVVVTASNAAGQGKATLTLLNTLTNGRLASPLSASGVVGSAFAYGFTTNLTSYSYSATGLPPGLSLNGSTGKITGTPTTGGTFVTTVSANTSNGTATGKVTFFFAATSPTRPDLTSAAGANAAVGDPFTYFLTVANSPNSASVANLPSGLTFDSARGVISGTPTVPGNFSVTVSATNAAGTTNGTLTLAVIATYNNGAKINSSASASASIGTAFSYTATTNQPSMSSFYVSNLPPGLSYNSSTFKIIGMPTGTGVYNSLMYAYTSQGTAAAYLTIAVDAGASAPPTISSPAAAAGTAGGPFSYKLAATGSPTSFDASNLPAGLSLVPATGVISGTPTTVGVFNVPVTAVNAVGTSSATLTFAVTAAAPNLDNTGFVATAYLGSTAVVYTVQAVNAPTSFSASALPPGLSINPVDGVISGTPTALGAFQTTVNAANASGSASAVVAIMVVNPSSSPQFSGYIAAALTGTVGASFSQTANASATGGGALVFTASNLPPGLYLDSGTGEIFGAPATAGTYTVALSVKNALGTDHLTLKLLIGSGPPSPTFSYTPASGTGRVGTPFSTYYNVSADSYVVEGLPPGLNYSIDSGALYLRGIPTASGIFPVTITASNATGASSAVVTLSIVDGPPPAPVISSAAGSSGVAGAAYQYSITASSAPTAYDASGLPDGLQLNILTGVISGVPTTAGSFPVTISAANAGGIGRATLTLRIDAAAPAANAVPVISSAASVYYNADVSASSYSYYYYPTSGSNLSYRITASNAPTTFAATGLPAGLTLNQSTGQISGHPLTAGTFRVSISATNAVGTGSATLMILALAALPPLQLPLMTAGYVGGDIYLSASNPYFYINYNNVYQEAVSYTASGLPPGLSLNATTGVIAGSPSQAGNFTTTVTATNRAGSASAVISFAIAAVGAAPTVPNSPPTFSGYAELAGYVGVPVDRYVYGSGNFVAMNLPPGLSLDAQTGRITGTPLAAGNYLVPLTTTNASGTGRATLTVDIAAAPAAPVINSDALAQAAVGTPFYYTINTNAFGGGVWPANGYGASNLPPGLNFNASSGSITGTPTTAGVYTVPISAVAGGVTGTATLTINVSSVPTTPLPFTPVFAGLSGAVGFAGLPFYCSLAITGFTPDTALPPGLIYDASHGFLSGVPTATGVFELPFSAEGSGGGAAGHGVFTLRIETPNLALPVITSQPVGGTIPAGQPTSLVAGAVGLPAPALQWTRDGASVSGATGPTLNLPSPQSADTGNYVLTAANSSGRVASLGAFLIVTQSFSGWQAAHFSKAEIAAGLAASGYDFNHDGVPNLLEYALGRDPRTGQGGTLPTGARSPAGNLQMQFTRDLGDTDLVYTVEASSDLANWIAIARSTAGSATANLGGAASVVESRMGGGTTVVTVQDAQSSSVAARRFLRLRVDQP